MSYHLVSKKERENPNEYLHIQQFKFNQSLSQIFVFFFHFLDKILGAQL